MKTILIVDDSDIIRCLLHRTLRDDYIVLTAMDGSEALRLAKLYKPDAIVLDVQMPGEFDGIAVCEQLKSDREFKHIHILLATGDINAALTNLGTSHHADDLILKPFKVAEVREKLRKIPQLI